MNIFSEQASESFNLWMQAQLDELASQVSSAMGDNLTALILGGGYGRGEGGILVRSGRETPYNDLDLFLVCQHPARVPFDALSRISHDFSKIMLIEVDFSRPLTISAIRAWKPCLMWHDLLNGHMVLHGNPDVLLANAPASIRDALKPIEGTRLLLNRGAGLLWAMRALRGLDQEPDPDFVRRNYYKCALALGDAILIASGSYQSRCSGREQAFALVEKKDPAVGGLNLSGLYQEALNFKSRPDSVPADTPDADRLAKLAGLWGKTLLYVESIRAGIKFESMDAYAACATLREPNQNTFDMLPRNALKNLRLGCLSCRHPRERLYRELPSLLGLTEARAKNWEKSGELFLKIWAKHN